MADKKHNTNKPKSALGRILVLVPFWSFIAYIILAVAFSLFANLYMNDPQDLANIAQRSWCHENLRHLSSRFDAHGLSSDLHQTLFPHREQVKYQKWLAKFEDYSKECAHFSNDLLLNEQKLTLI